MKRKTAKEILAESFRELAEKKVLTGSRSRILLRTAAIRQQLFTVSLRISMI